MAIFTYQAMNSVGQPVKGEVEAVNSDEAIAKVRAQGNFPTKIKERSVRRAKRAAPGAGQTPARGRRRTVGRVPVKVLTQFTRQLSTLVDAGLPIVRSLDILEQQQKPGPMRLATRLVKEEVTEGSSLSDAMKRHPKAFDQLYTNMVRAGELGGVLDVILQRLSDFMEKSEALKRKVKGAMVYPVAVITFALAIVTLLLIMVVPKFERIFADMGSGLPAITQALLNMSDWMTGGGWIVILGTPVGVILLAKLLRQSSGGAFFLDRFKLNVPIMGKIIGKTAVARFCRTLGTLLAAGVPILEALNITRDTSGNAVYARALNKVHDAIREGENFATPLRQSRAVEPMVVNMIDVGEETGELDTMLSKIADTYDDEVDTMVSAMTSLMEPVMVIVLGGIVGFIVVALFMPMVGMLEALSQ